MRSHILVGLFGAAMVAGCGDSSTTTTSSTGSGGDAATSATSTSATSATSGTSSSSSSAGGSTPDCEPPDGTASAAQKIQFLKATGTVNDFSGKPVDALYLELCGTNICLYGKTDSGGGFSIVNTGSDKTMNRPLFKPGDGISYTKIGFPVTMGTVTVDGLSEPLTDSGMPFTAGTTVTAGKASLDIGAGTNFSFDITVEEADQTFRAAEIPADKIETAAPGQGFIALYGIGPAETVVCGTVNLTVPNDAALPAGTFVEFDFQELSIEENYGTYGEWTKIAGGHVSTDGKTISSETGLPVLGTIGIKATK